MKPHGEQFDFLVLGAGIAGLAAASDLKERALLVEREDRPGGLVRTERFGDYWFDHCLHLLYFADETSEETISSLPDVNLAPCPPEAWVRTGEGIVRYPFQMHLGALPVELVVKCLNDLAAATFGPQSSSPKNFEETLLRTFGPGICEAFLFPYNRKLWKRPLTEMAPGNFQWTITHPNYAQVLRGAVNQNTTFRSYNAKGWYPQPCPEASSRGMEVLSAALARQTSNLRLGHRITSIDLDRRSVLCEHSSGEIEFRYRHGICSTLPMTHLVRLCPQMPASLSAPLSRLKSNRVVSVMMSMRGPRPQDRGHWEYYSDNSLCFNRLVYMHRFDPLLAPSNGWGVVAEITEPSETPTSPAKDVIAKCLRDMSIAGAIPANSKVIDAHILTIDPAFVVNTPEREDIVESAAAFLRASGLEPLGRYGRWEYSSIGQVFRDGTSWARSVRERFRGN